MFYGLCRMITSVIGPNISPQCVGTLTVEGPGAQQEGGGVDQGGAEKGFSERRQNAGENGKHEKQPWPPCRCFKDQRSGRKRKQDSLEFSSSSRRGRGGGVGRRSLSSRPRKIYGRDRMIATKFVVFPANREELGRMSGKRSFTAGCENSLLI